MSWDLLTIGLTTLDVVAVPVNALTHTERAILVEQIACLPAGTAAGAALVSATLGLSVAHVGAVGDDHTGDYIRVGLERAGVDTRHLMRLAGQRSSTTLLAVESSGTRSSYHALGAAGALAISPDVVEAARAARFVHYGAVGGQGTDGGPGADLLRNARAAGAVVTCDLISPRPGAREEIVRLMPHVDVFMPSAAEARALSGEDNLAAAAGVFLDQGARACIIKNGPEGAYVATAERRTVVPAHDIQAVDTTSCGDSFCAGFIAATAKGAELVEAVRFAAATAALVAQGAGTLGHLIDHAATLKAMKEMPVRQLSDAAIGA